jgi:hypothetical protein
LVYDDEHTPYEDDHWHMPSFLHYNASIDYPKMMLKRQTI